MATIRLRGNRWQCVIKRKGHPTLYQTFDLKKDAEKWGRQQERLIDVGQWVDRTEAEQTTLGELLERYATEVSSTKRGYEVELIRINSLKKTTLAKHSVASITGQVISTWRDSRLKQVSGSTVAREMQLLSHVFSVAIREWSFNINGNPVSKVRKPRSAPARDRVLTDRQREDLLKALGDCRNPWIRPLVLFALETAARRGEILSLEWGCVDLQRMTVKVDGKTGCRYVPLSPTCIAMLKSLPRSLDGRVFPVTTEAVRHAYERAVIRAGIENFTFHDLRHDALTRLAKMGLNVLELRSVSGHTSTTMLQRYVSIDAGDLAEKIAQRTAKR